MRKIEYGGLYVLRGICPGVDVLGGICPGGKCPGGKCPGGKCLGGYRMTKAIQSYKVSHSLEYNSFSPKALWAPRGDINLDDLELAQGQNGLWCRCT